MEDLFGHEKVRTIGLYQPYATLMLYGKIESRWVRSGRKAPFPLGKYLIYSTKKAYKDYEFKRLSGETFYEARKCFGFEELIPACTNNLNGFAIAVGDLVEVCPMPIAMLERAFFIPPTSELEYDAPDGQLRIDGYTLWALVYNDVKRIKPFPFKGKQGVGILTEAQRKKIEFL